jgi:hypothetical protein
VTSALMALKLLRFHNDTAPLTRFLSRIDSVLGNQILFRPPGYGLELVNSYDYWAVLTIPGFLLPYFLFSPSHGFPFGIAIENFTAIYLSHLQHDYGSYNNSILLDFNQGRQKSTAGTLNIFRPEPSFFAIDYSYLRYCQSDSDKCHYFNLSNW